MYSLRFPAPALAPYIENYWSVRPAVGETLELVVDVFVDARADLICNFGAPYTRTIRGSDPTIVQDSNLDAQRTRPIRIRQAGAVDIAGVRFRTGGLAPFAIAPLAEVTDTTPPLDRVFGSSPLLDELRACDGDPDAQRECFDRFFLARLVADGPRAAFHAAKSAVERSGGRLAVEAVAAEAGLSVRQLVRLFDRFLGLSPKVFSRIVRFQSALGRLMHDPGVSLAELATDCGWYDQPHFIRDFRRFTGGVPRGYRGYFPKEGPSDFAPNVVRFVQDAAPRARHSRAARPSSSAATRENPR